MECQLQQDTETRIESFFLSNIERANETVLGAIPRVEVDSNIYRNNITETEKTIATIKNMHGELEKIYH